MIDIITLAQQAGFITGTMHDEVSGECHTLVDSAGRGCLRELTRFAELVAAAEREECARACDEYVQALPFRHTTTNVLPFRRGVREGEIAAAKQISAVIRNKGE